MYTRNKMQTFVSYYGSEGLRNCAVQRVQSLHFTDFTHFNTHSLEKCHPSLNFSQADDIKEAFNFNQDHQEFNPIILGLDPE